MAVVNVLLKWIRAASSYSFIINVGLTFLIALFYFLNIYLEFYQEKDELQVYFADLNAFIASEYGPYPEIENDAMSPHLVFINSGTVDIVLSDIEIDLISLVRGAENHYLYYHEFVPIIIPSNSVEIVKLDTIWFPIIDFDAELDKPSFDYESKYLIRNGIKSTGQGTGIEHDIKWRFITIGPLHGRCTHRITYGHYIPFSKGSNVLGTPISETVELRHEKINMSRERSHWRSLFRRRSDNITEFYGP